MAQIARLLGFWKMFRSKKLGIIGLSVILSFAVIGLFANYLSPYSIKITEGDRNAILKPPSATHIFGTDELGRDMATLVIYGSRISLLIGFLASILGSSVGLVIGLFSGYGRKIVDTILMRVTEQIMVIPFLPLMIVLAAILGPSLWNLIFVLGIVGWTGTARIIRAQVLSLKERPFVEASRGLGAGTFHVIFRHILPNVLPVAFCQIILGVQGAILAEAGLSFLGLGDPSSLSWGMILHDAFSGGALSRGAYWYILPPGLFITLTVLSFTFLGNSIDEILNPKGKER